jgi:cytosine/adenosine deaminase-related metal-dependent hydrolase
MEEVTMKALLPTAMTALLLSATVALPPSWDFQRYRDRGVMLSIATDSYPQDMLLEMQYASMLAKVARRDHEAASAGTVFSAATLGGAAALKRPDLGRLCPGAKADMVIVDFTDPRVGPVFDPIKALLHAATSDLVERVLIDGRTVYSEGKVVAWATPTLLRDAQRSCEQVWNSVRDWHWSASTVTELFAPSIESWPANTGH